MAMPNAIKDAVMKRPRKDQDEISEGFTIKPKENPESDVVAEGGERTLQRPTDSPHMSGQPERGDRGH